MKPAAERWRAVPMSVFYRQRAEQAEAVLREVNTLLQAARIGCVKAGYAGALQVGMFRLEGARDKAQAFVADLDAALAADGDE